MELKVGDLVTLNRESISYSRGFFSEDFQNVMNNENSNYRLFKVDTILTDEYSSAYDVQISSVKLKDHPPKQMIQRVYFDMVKPYNGTLTKNQVKSLLNLLK